MSTPLLLLTGVDEDAMADAMMGLQWDLRRAVAVRHTIDIEEQVLTRVVSDLTGVIELEEIDLDHACVTCALREDIMPTLERLASDGRWATVISHLPVAADASQVCRILAYDSDLGSSLHVAAVLAVVDGPYARRDVLGDDLLADRGLGTSEDDRRGVAEVHAAMIEYADAVIVVGEIEPTDRDLVTMLTRPGASVHTDHLSVDAAALAARRRDHEDAEAWVHPKNVRRVEHRDLGDVWTLDLRSDRPFHPDRLRDNIEGLGGGDRRSRGCFWLPTRPDAIFEWDGAGGQLSVGTCQHGLVDTRHTRILVTGVGVGRRDVAALFEQCLLTDQEMTERGCYWEATTDGFEPWLGSIREAA